MTNRSEVLCLDLNGLYDGNDGSFRSEADYLSSGGSGPASKANQDASIGLDPTDADIIWAFNLCDELGSFPHQISMSSPVSDGRYLYLNVPNGVDWSHKVIPSPSTPQVVKLTLETGELAGESLTSMDQDIVHASRSSVGLIESNSGPQVLVAGGDGNLRSFHSTAKPDREGFLVFPQLFHIDCLPNDLRFGPDGKKLIFRGSSASSEEGPLEIIAPPVYAGGMVFVNLGNPVNRAHGRRVGGGVLTCFAINDEGAQVVWRNREVGPSQSTVSVTSDCVFLGDEFGSVFCIDLRTGETIWKLRIANATNAHTLVNEGTLYVTSSTDIVILPASREADQDSDGFISSSELTRATRVSPWLDLSTAPIAANGTLYITSQSRLFAFSR
ncbi:MAG: PQQ-binding-like beta-propeller repeat protein [Verrucomicrobiota bacterium]